MKLTPPRIIAAGWAVFLLYAYPGYVDTAASDMLMESRAEQFGDWHAPVMAKLWYYLGHFVAGPPGMLLLQSGLLLVGAYDVLRRATTDRTAAFLASGVLLFPPVLAMQAVVSAHALFAGLAVAGAALLASARPARKIGGLALLLVAAGLHVGATLAVFPLVLVGFRWNETMRWLPRFALAAVAWLVIAAGAYGLERWIVDDASERPDVLLAKYDLEGIVRQTRQPNLEVELLLRLPGERPADRAALLDARDKLKREHTGAYAKHRFRHLRGLLRPSPHVYVRFTQTPEDASMIAHRARHSLVQRALIVPVRLLSRTPLFWPIVYLLAAIACTVVAIMRRQHDVIVWFASGIFCEVAAMFWTTTTEARHSHWLVTSTVIGLALFALALRRKPSNLPP